MSKTHKVRSPHESRLIVALRKLFVSSFVVFSFIAYVVHNNLSNEKPINNEKTSSTVKTQSQKKVVLNQAVPTSQFLKPTLEPTQTPTQRPPTASPTDKPQGQYIDGTYTGPIVNAFYGLVQVQATVQNDELTNVNFLQYPDDRRTSRRINSIAMPRLTQEAIQAQSAYVNIVSGATLTSQAFAQSLYVALNQAVSQS